MMCAFLSFGCGVAVGALFYYGVRLLTDIMAGRK